MDRIRQLVTGAADLVLIALGIVALIAAPQAGFCVNDLSGGAACVSGTQILDLLGFGLIAIGATWAFAKRWPASIGNRVAMFIATWAIVVLVGSVWAYGMLSDWHWGPYCDTPDTCSLSPDIGGAIGFFTLVGVVIAGVAARGILIPAVLVALAALLPLKSWDRLA